MPFALNHACHGHLCLYQLRFPACARYPSLFSPAFTGHMRRQNRLTAILPVESLELKLRRHFQEKSGLGSPVKSQIGDLTGLLQALA